MKTGERASTKPFASLRLNSLRRIILYVIVRRTIVFDANGVEHIEGIIVAELVVVVITGPPPTSSGKHLGGCLEAGEIDVREFNQVAAIPSLTISTAATASERPAILVSKTRRVCTTWNGIGIEINSSRPGGCALSEHAAPRTFVRRQQLNSSSSNDNASLDGIPSRDAANRSNKLRRSADTTRNRLTQKKHRESFRTPEPISIQVFDRNMMSRQSRSFGDLQMIQFQLTRFASLNR